MKHLRLVALTILALWMMPFATQAAVCCLCSPPGDSGSKTCVKSETVSTCAELRNQTSNATLKAATCDLATLKPTECLPKSAPGGLCQNGPVLESEFAKPSGYIVQQAALVPKLNVAIPGLVFANQLGESGGFLTIPFFGQYIAAVYRYLVGISAVVAAVMIVYGGFLYIVGSAVPQIKRGKEIMSDAIIGLVLLLGSYLILNTINPDLLNLSPLRIRPITTEDYKFMITSEAGFKYADGAAENERAAEQLPIGGSLPAVAPQLGENVTIDDIPVQGTTAPEKMRSYCTSPGAAAQLKTYEEKTQALVRVMLGWKKVCVDQKGCAYYRGGVTNMSNGKIIGTLLDIPYAIKVLKTFAGKDPAWSSDCARRWGPLADGFYAPVKTDGTKEGLKKATDTKNEAYKDFKGGGVCYQAVYDQYQEEFARRYEDRGIFGGDCGTTLVQAYSCATGPQRLVRGSAAMYLSGGLGSAGLNRPNGKDIVVWNANSWEDYINQVNAAGGLRFGDLFSIGAQNWQHNLMYTGGRQDVPFDWFEMGSSGRDGLTGTMVNVGLNAPVGGVAAWPRGTSGDFFLELAKKRGKKIFPIFVWRPFDFEPCGSNAECKEGEACHCTPLDSKGFLRNNCSNAFVCHKIRAGAFCTTDEHCGKGEVCMKKTPNSPSGTCRKP